MLVYFATRYHGEHYLKSGVVLNSDLEQSMWFESLLVDKLLMEMRTAFLTHLYSNLTWQKGNVCCNLNRRDERRAVK